MPYLHNFTTYFPTRNSEWVNGAIAVANQIKLTSQGCSMTGIAFTQMFLTGSEVSSFGSGEMMLHPMIPSRALFGA